MLKLIADVGLVGQPNAGKSTLLSVISAAHPKIADYPFTTLSPNLGVVQLSDHRSFVVADIPGIIEGAHEGKGLGLQFLRHIERTRILAFLIPVDSMDWQAEYDGLRAEVRSYSAELAETPHCVVFTKMDLLGELEPPPIAAPQAFGIYAISAAGRMGLDELLGAFWSKLLELRKAAQVRGGQRRSPLASTRGTPRSRCRSSRESARCDSGIWLQRFGSPVHAWDATPPSPERNTASDCASSALECAARTGAQLIVSGDDEYPARLADLPDPPPVLFAIGALEPLRSAVRRHRGHETRHQLRRAGDVRDRERARARGRDGVSGMARGIDGAAHRAALAADGNTVAVLGTGVDVAYPAAHRSLHAEIAERGLLLSEELPGDRASGGSFPKRNRIIAALATSTIVVEAPHAAVR